MRRELTRSTVALLAVACVLGALAPASALGKPAVTWSQPHLIDKPSRASGRLSLYGVSCTSPSLCAAVDQAGKVLTSTHPSRFRSWKATTAAGPSCAPGHTGLRGHTGLHCRLDAISCPTASACVVVGGGARVVTSRNPLGGRSSWSPTRPIQRARELSAVSCPSTHFCAAVDVDGHLVTSTHPFGGADRWRVRKVPSRGTEDVSCPSKSVCFVAQNNPTDVATLRHPTRRHSTWRRTTIGGGFRFALGISCPSRSLCAVVGWGGVTTRGMAATSTHPAGKRARWRVRRVGGRTGPEAVSCPTESLCAAINANGRAATSTHPTGGASAWPVQKIGTQARSDVSCAPRGPCVVVDGLGHAVVGRRSRH